MTSQNSARNNQTRPESLMNKYGIKKDTYYSRLKFLGIQVMKDSNRRVYLTDDQVALMDELHSYISETGKMEGFQPSNNGSLAVRETGEIDQAAQQVNLENSQPIPQEPHQDQFAALVRSSAEFAAGMEISKYTIAKQMQENPDLLPSDLREQVEAAKASCSPKSLCPTAVAESAPPATANQFLAAYKA